MKADAPLRVQVPGADDQPRWIRVGVIALVGFVVGVGWPRLLGAKLGPSLPADLAPSASVASAARSEAPAPPASAHPEPAPAPATPPAAPAATSMPALTVNHGVLLSCRTDDGETLKGVAACGGLAGFDGIAQPRLRKLGTCPAATGGTNGKLSVVFSLDFVTKHVGAEVGKASTVQDPQGFATCVKSAFQGVSLGALDHQNPKYAIAYNIQFTATAPDSAPSGPSDGVPAASVTPSKAPPSSPAAAAAAKDDSSVEVAWEVAIVRDSPRTGAVVARLPRGSKVKIGTSQEGWYKVDYGSGEGWVYRGAIGR
jgi:hypothetical protein